MDDLIERLLQAEGPDRELDADIAAKVFGGEIVWKTANYTMEPTPVRRYASKMHVGGFGNEYVPRVTGSIDAAYGLIPQGFKLKLGYSKHVPHVATLVDYNDSPKGSFIGECDTHPAIAICLAALRARAHD